MADAPTQPSGTLANGEPIEQLRREVGSMRSQFNVALLALIVLSGTFFVFLLREVSLARRQVRDLSQFVAEYQRTGLPVMEEFRLRLDEFSKSNPDFKPILDKYFSPTSLVSSPLPASRLEPADPPSGPVNSAPR